MNRNYVEAKERLKIQGMPEKGIHFWFCYGDGLEWECCLLCGVVRRVDNSNKPCIGLQQKISLRD